MCLCLDGCSRPARSLRQAALPNPCFGAGHPFMAGRYLFMHNGVVGGFARVKRSLLDVSELVCLWAPQRIGTGRPMVDTVH